MAKLYGREYSRAELLERVGDVFQLGGARRITLADGPEAGVEAVEFRTGSGLNFTVLPGRGMDISLAEYRGYPLAWRSATGETAAAYYEPEGLGWLRGFYGGLVVTCGLTYSGHPSVDDGEELGLHGRASNLVARNVWVDGAWEGDEYVMWAQGKLKEAVVFGANLCLIRRIWARLGEKCFHLEDEVENLGYERTPHMLVYHINPGFPLVDEGARLVSPTEEVRPLDEVAQAEADDFRSFHGPKPHFQEQVFFHRMATDAEGKVCVAVVNEAIPLGFYMIYRREQLPYFTQWKQLGQGTYVVGVEPGNCTQEGRAISRERGELEFLEPGETRRYELTLGVLTSQEEIANFEQQARVR